MPTHIYIHTHTHSKTHKNTLTHIVSEGGRPRKVRNLYGKPHRRWQRVAFYYTPRSFFGVHRAGTRECVLQECAFYRGICIILLVLYYTPRSVSGEHRAGTREYVLQEYEGHTGMCVYYYSRLALYYTLRSVFLEYIA